MFPLFLRFQTLLEVDPLLGWHTTLLDERTRTRHELVYRMRATRHYREGEVFDYYMPSR